MKVLNLHEFNEEYLRLCEDTLDALKELESLTGKEVIFRIIEKSEAKGYFKLKIKLARSFMENHIIIINKDVIKDKNDLNCYIVHEVMHGLRTFNAKPNERKVLSFNENNSELLIEEILKTMDETMVMSMGKDNMRIYCNNLILNTNMVLFNNSVDARIELGIYKKYPGLRKLQKKVQKEYLKELQAGFVNAKVKKYTPSWILERVNLMNYCYMQKVTPIIGKAWTSKINGVIDETFKNKAEEMMHYLNKDDFGQISDNETILAWSKILGMDNYTRLIDFENVNYSYLMSN